MGDETSTPLFNWCVMRSRTGTSALSVLPVRSKASRIFLFANRKFYFLSVISAYSVKQINSFHKNIDKQFHMFMMRSFHRPTFIRPASNTVVFLVKIISPTLCFLQFIKLPFLLIKSTFRACWLDIVTAVKRSIDHFPAEFCALSC